MISNASPGDAWSAEAVAGLSEGMVRDDHASAPLAAADALRTVELDSAEGWCELIRDILAVANSGGGRLVIHCIPSDPGHATDAVFSAPIKSVAGPKTSDAKLDGKVLGPAKLQPVRIVTDPDAPALQPQDVDHLYPWRQKDLLRELNRRLGRRMLNSYDIQAVRRQHHLDERPDFVFNLPGAGRRYSPAVADWFMEQLGRDAEFFHHARMADHEIMKLRRQKPK
jgi:hypothetical protein